MGDTSADLQQIVRTLAQQVQSLQQLLQAGQEQGERMQTQLQDAQATAQQASQTAREANARAQAAQALAQGQAAQAMAQGHQAEMAAPQPSLAVANSLKPKSPEEFDPAKKKDVDTWLFQVDVYYQLHPQLSDLVKIIDCSSYFRGAAQTWWRHLASSRDVSTMTWAEFRAAIQTRWQLVNTVRTARDRIANIRQLTSVQDFTQRFLDLKVQIPAMTEEEAIDKYVRGLKPGIRRDLEQLMAREGDRTLEELIRYADRTDSIDFQARRYRPAGPTPMELGALEDKEEDEDLLYEDQYAEENEEGFSDDQQLAAVRTQRRAKVKGRWPMRRVSPEEIARRRDNNLCYICGEAGHQSRICPQRRRPPQSGRRKTRQLSTIELCALGSVRTAPVRTSAQWRLQTLPGGSQTVSGNPHTAHEVHDSVRGKFNSVHGTPNSARGKFQTVNGNPYTMRGKKGDVRRTARGKPTPSSADQPTSQPGARHQKTKLEWTHRVVSRTQGLPRALSHGAQVPSPLAPEPSEVVLAGMGVDPLKLTGSVEGRPVSHD
jgi:chemotaxis protein histidine kinase CheA